MSKNLTAVPAFGYTTEYLELSKSLVPDEYRPILYPLILRAFLFLGEDGYQTALYLFQTLVSFLSIFYGIYTLDRSVFQKKNEQSRMRRVLFFSLYVLTIPMVTFMNFSTLTDSMATSLLIILLSGCVRMLQEENVRSWVYVSIFFSFAAQSLLRADRFYSILLLLILMFFLRLKRKPGQWKRILITMLIVCLCAVGTVRTVDHYTQVPGSKGRITTTFEFILLDRIVWPNMGANYSYFSQEIQNTITLEEARTFDSHNNNVMYQMAPLVESRVGKEAAQDMYVEMAKVVFARQPGKVMKDIAEDILAMAATPYSSLLNVYGLCSKADSWNIYCMSTVTPGLTAVYNHIYQWLFLALTAAAVIAALRRGKRYGKQSKKRFGGVILPYILASLLLTLWFCLGDGAPPNDRYALIIYVTWALMVAGSFILPSFYKMSVDKDD